MQKLLKRVSNLRVKADYEYPCKTLIGAITPLNADVFDEVMSFCGQNRIQALIYHQNIDPKILGVCEERWHKSKLNYVLRPLPRESNKISAGITNASTWLRDVVGFLTDSNGNEYLLNRNKITNDIYDQLDISNDNIIDCVGDKSLCVNSLTGIFDSTQLEFGNIVSDIHGNYITCKYDSNINLKQLESLMQSSVTDGSGNPSLLNFQTAVKVELMNTTTKFNDLTQQLLQNLQKSHDNNNDLELLRIDTPPNIDCTRHSDIYFQFMPNSVLLYGKYQLLNDLEKKCYDKNDINNVSLTVELLEWQTKVDKIMKQFELQQKYNVIPIPMPLKKIEFHPTYMNALQLLVEKEFEYESDSGTDSDETESKQQHKKRSFDDTNRCPIKGFEYKILVPCYHRYLQNCRENYFETARFEKVKQIYESIGNYGKYKDISVRYIDCSEMIRGGGLLRCAFVASKYGLKKYK